MVLVVSAMLPQVFFRPLFMVTMKVSWQMSTEVPSVMLPLLSAVASMPYLDSAFLSIFPVVESVCPVMRMLCRAGLSIRKSPVSESKHIPRPAKNDSRLPSRARSSGEPVCRRLLGSVPISHIVSAICRASSMSWVDRNTVFPASWLIRYKSSIVSTLLG